MYLFADFIEPAELTGYARESLYDIEANRFQLSRFLPSETIDDIDYRFRQGGEGLTEAATFRNYDTPSRFGARPGVTEVTGSLPPVSRQIKLGEYDRLKLRKAGQDAYVQAIYDDADRMSRAVAARIELARGEALSTGKVVIGEGGVVATADYKRSASHTVTAATPWTNVTTSTPLTNMIAWADTYEASNNGVRPEDALISRARMRSLTRNKEIIDAIKGSTTGNTRVTEDELRQLLESEGLPMPTVIEEKISVNRTATRVLPADAFIYVPAAGGDSDLGATLWGITAESGEPEYGLEGDEPGIVAGVYKQPNPLAYFTNAVGIALPVLANPDLTFKATV